MIVSHLPLRDLRPLRPLRPPCPAPQDLNPTYTKHQAINAAGRRDHCSCFDGIWDEKLFGEREISRIIIPSPKVSSLIRKFGRVSQCHLWGSDKIKRALNGTIWLHHTDADAGRPLSLVFAAASTWTSPVGAGDSNIVSTLTRRRRVIFSYDYRIYVNAQRPLKIWRGTRKLDPLFRFPHYSGKVGDTAAMNLS